MAMLVITRGYNFLLSSDLHHDESFKTISILLVQVGRSTTQRLAIFNFCKLTDTKTSWSKTKADLPKAGGSQENHRRLRDQNEYPRCLKR